MACEQYEFGSNIGVLRLLGRTPAAHDLVAQDDTTVKFSGTAEAALLQTELSAELLSSNSSYYPFPPAAAGSREAPMMPTLHRLTGRFFTVLISLSLAILLPRAAFAGGSSKSPSPTLCQISDTVYRADGTPAQGTVLVSWQGFTTAAGQAVTPGSLLVTLDANGGFNASVAPNTGASPAGTYYKAIFKLSDGTTETEYWVVPNAQTTTIGAIRSKLVPASQAAQFLTRDYADSTYVSLASTQTITGTKTFSVSPAVPTPQNPTDAANKSYVDNNSGGAQQLLGQPNTWSSKQTFSVSPAVPTPQNPTDAANKSYVDNNSGGAQQLLGQANTWSGKQTFSVSPAVPSPQNPTDAANKSYVANNSGGTQLLGQPNTWSSKQTFSVSPAVPTPQNPTDAANKSYVDANAGSNLSAPPPIGNVTPNTVAATTLTAGDSRTSLFPYIDVRAYGAVGDALAISGCSITATTKQLICSSGNFTSGAVGKTIIVLGAGPSDGYAAPLITTVASYTSATTVNLTAAAAQTVAGNGSGLFGTDNASAFCNAAQCTQAVYTGEFASGINTGRELYIPGGAYLTSEPVYC